MCASLQDAIGDLSEITLDRGAAVPDIPNMKVVCLFVCLPLSLSLSLSICVCVCVCVSARRYSHELTCSLNTYRNYYNGVTTTLMKIVRAAI